jgi:hypothetical protein
MEKNINITNTKENTIEMDIEIEGIDSKNKKCFFVIKTKEVSFSFECNNSKGNKWSVVIPKMPQIENTMYDFYIYMVIDGYYFEPYSGSINVIKSNEIFVKNISNKTFKPSEKIVKAELPKEEKTTEESVKEIKSSKGSISEIARKIMKKSEPKTKEELIKEQKVKDILNISKTVENSSVKIKKGKRVEF